MKPQEKEKRGPCWLDMTEKLKKERPVRQPRTVAVAVQYLTGASPPSTAFFLEAGSGKCARPSLWATHTPRLDPSMPARSTDGDFMICKKKKKNKHIRTHAHAHAHAHAQPTIVHTEKTQQTQGAERWPGEVGSTHVCMQKGVTFTRRYL